MRFFFATLLISSLGITCLPSVIAGPFTGVVRVTNVINMDDSIYHPDFFFVENENRSFAAKVTSLASGQTMPAVGAVINLSGELDTSNFRRIITNATYTTANSSFTINALGINNLSLYRSINGRGPSLFGAIATIWGRVWSQPESEVIQWDQIVGSYYFYVSDGTGRWPGGEKSLRVYCNEYNEVIVGQYISVCGTVDIDASDTENNFPTIWPTSTIKKY